jgi:hypothetical protein
MRPVTLFPVIALFAMAAAPPSSFTTVSPLPPQFLTPAPTPPPVETPPGFTTAPTPNDISAPIPPTSKDATVGPGFFTRRDQYRGEGLSAGSSAQIEQDRRAKPGAGVSITMPLQ